DLPWSMCAMIEKLRMWDCSMRGLFLPTAFRAETNENSTLRGCIGADDARRGWCVVRPSAADDALVA
ncbi:MAG: hypothetical protein ACO33D_07475, partial [Ilumatobacteraceae bacterium]